MNRGQITTGQKSADKVAAVIGSWKVIVVQIVILILWIIVNVVAWIKHWDPYPFILLNLLLSVQAAFAGPIILMSQNRMAEKDRHKAEMDLATDRKAEREIQDIQQHLHKIEKKLDDVLVKKGG